MNKIKILIITYLFVIALSLSLNFLTPKADTEEKHQNITFNHSKLLISDIILNEVWYKTYEIDNNYEDYGVSIALESNNNSHVVGYSNNESNTKAFYLKYNNDGEIEWEKIWGSDGAKCYDIFIDAEDNAYITGYYLDGTSCFVNTLKFDAIGDLKWNSTWKGQGSIGGSGAGITMDKDGYIYITGDNGTNDNKNDIFLLKLDNSSGMVLTEWIYKSGGFLTSGNDIICDSDNNLYIVGTNGTGIESFSNIILLKYNSTRDLEWVKIWNNPYELNPGDYGSSVAVDSNDNIYLIGSVKGSIGYDILILKYNSTGYIKWEELLDFSEEEDANDIKIKDDRILALANYNNLGHQRITLMEYDTEGNQIWNKKFGGVVDHDAGFSLAINGPEIMITGKTFSYAIGYKPDAFISKYAIESDNIIPGGGDGDDDGGNNNGKEVISGYPIYTLLGFNFFVITGLIFIYLRKRHI